jgi:hypothetical protein
MPAAGLSSGGVARSLTRLRRMWQYNAMLGSLDERRATGLRRQSSNQKRRPSKPQGARGLRRHSPFVARAQHAQTGETS